MCVIDLHGVRACVCAACVCFRRDKAVNKMTLLFPLSYHVEKPIMVMLSMSGNLRLPALSLTVLFIPSILFSLSGTVSDVVSQEMTFSLEH